jgi:molybdate transport system regulatory protein
MDLDADFDALLAKDGVGFGQRDAALLRAIHREGSLNKAANTLGRSYSRAQRRVVELEDAFGQLVDRQRGGSGGGGSSLTDAADELLAEFDRLEAEFTGVTEVEETVLAGRVVETDGELGVVETAAGRLRAIVPTGVRQVRLAIRADAITLHTPGAVPARETDTDTGTDTDSTTDIDTDTSARNHLRGDVREVVAGDAVARVLLDVDADTDLAVLVTQTSVEALALAPGEPVAASFKATATRAYPAESY